MLFGMRQTRVVLIALLLAVGLSVPARAQMDMLPQIFRDLPPELQQGLPADMTYEEYRELTRNVDFFTMFMSMWFPGYGSFQVERPRLGWGIAGIRALGYGMMGAAVYRQWEDFRSLGRLEELSDVEFQSFLTNAFLFGGGVVLNGFGWAADVLAAYHISKWEKDFVIYKYGLQRGLSAGESQQTVGEGRADAEERRIAYIRRLVLQADDRYVEEDLLRELEAYTASYPDGGAYGAEVEYYLGTSYARIHEDARALLHYSRSFLFHPDSRFADNARREAIRLIHENREDWKADWEQLTTIVRSTDHDAGDAKRQELFSRYLEEFARFETPSFRELFVEEALRFSLRYREEEFADDALRAAALQLQRAGRYRDAAITLTELAARFPDSELAPQALLDVGTLLSDELDAAPYAEAFYRRVVDGYPESEAADRARNRLTGAANRS